MDAPHGASRATRWGTTSPGDVTPAGLTSQSARLKKVGPPRTTRQTNPWMASMSRETDKRRRQLHPDRPTSWE